MEKERPKTGRIVTLAILGLLVIIAVVIWSLFYSKSQAPVEPVYTPPATVEQQSSEAAGEEPPAAPEEVPVSEAEAADAEVVPEEGKPSPDEQATAVTDEEEPAEEEATAPPAAEKEQVAEETVEAKAPVEEAAEAETVTEEPVPAEEAAEVQAAEPEEAATEEKKLPSITFMDEKVEQSFENSRFFATNRVSPSGNPFAPPPNRILPRYLQGPAEQIESFPGMSELLEQGVETGEIPLLPMPGELLGPEIQVRLIGVSQSGSNSTAMFAVTGGEGESIILAHAGWLVGNDYVFIGAENGRAKIFDRRSNTVIQLSTGETL